MSDVQAISATRRALKEMADGTIRVQVDIDPRFKADFLRLFPNIDTPCALAPLVADFEQRAAQAEAAKGNGPHGKQYEVLYRAGWFHNPKVVAALGVNMALEPAARIDAIKSLIYEYFGVGSLTEISPAEFCDYCVAAGIRATLPSAFGAA